MSTDAIAEQPAEQLPLNGGEHIDTPEGIRFNLADYLQLVDWTSRYWLQGMGTSRRLYHQ